MSSSVSATYIMPNITQIGKMNVKNTDTHFFRIIYDVDFNLLIFKKSRITQYITCNLPLPAYRNTYFPVGSGAIHPLIHYFLADFVKHFF
jgi:hypothetical protein